MTLQARGPGLAPINTSAGGESFIAWLEREGYTSISWSEEVKKSAPKPEARRVVRRPRTPEPTHSADTPRPRRVVRRPSAKSG